jgi:4-hydroxy-tetrahydrodipicolinate reductase
VRAPYRVAVWGPGTIGTAAIRELLLLPETELVGVLAYSESKKGVDAGTLVGMDPVGVPVTTSRDELIATRPEIVVHAPRDYGDFQADDDIVALLESGIDVVTVLPYQYPAIRPQDAIARLLAAGRARRGHPLRDGHEPGVPDGAPRDARDGRHQRRRAGAGRRVRGLLGDARSR